jgi:hypothetical protein
MPLERLELGPSDMTDLGPLAGMPLNTLGINQVRATNIQVLLGLPLKLLLLSPKKLADDISVLRYHSTLTNVVADGWTAETEALVPTDVFWRRYDLIWYDVKGSPGHRNWDRAIRMGRTALHSYRFADALWLFTDAQWHLDHRAKDDETAASVLFEYRTEAIATTNLLAFVIERSRRPPKEQEEMTRQRLSLENPGSKGLSVFVVKGDRLTDAAIADPKVVCITALTGLHLESLDISDTGVIDFTPLLGMPLRELRLPPGERLPPESRAIIESLKAQKCKVECDTTASE